MMSFMVSRPPVLENGRGRWKMRFLAFALSGVLKYCYATARLASIRYRLLLTQEKSMEFNNLSLETKDGICFLTINRPNVLNALSVKTIKELDKAIEAIAEDDDVRGVIISGAGDKSFVAGADISELHPLDEKGAQKYASRGQDVLMKIEYLSKPVIAAVNGFALGGGCELAMACHMRVASERSKFGQPEVRLGVIPGYGGTQRLPRLVGKGRAMEMCLTGDMIDAAEAYRIGLVNRICPPDKVLEEAEKIMRVILEQGPVAVALAIQAINEGLDEMLEDAMDVEADLFGECATTEDWKEGTKAFMEKRKAEFKGK
jgi:enoyl-CoA hydratase